MIMYYEMEAAYLSTTIVWTGQEPCDELIDFSRESKINLHMIESIVRNFLQCPPLEILLIGQ
jgi:hypothetical protein